MSIEKTTLHPENNGSVDLYPRTSADQIEDLIEYLVPYFISKNNESLFSLANNIINGDGEQSINTKDITNINNGRASALFGRYLNNTGAYSILNGYVNRNRSTHNLLSGSNNGCSGNNSVCVGYNCIFGRPILLNVAEQYDDNFIYCRLVSTSDFGIKVFTIERNFKDGDTVVAGHYKVLSTNFKNDNITSSFVGGRNSIVGNSNAFAYGRNIENYGFGSGAIGEEIFIGEHSVNSFASGRFIKLVAGNNFAFGEGLICSYSNHCTLFGKYNIDVPNALLIIGNGTDSNNRSNSLVIYNDGRVEGNISSPSALTYKHTVTIGLPNNTNAVVVMLSSDSDIIDSNADLLAHFHAKNVLQCYLDNGSQETLTSYTLNNSILNIGGQTIDLNNITFEDEVTYV